ncbi:DUF6262 family protein [Nonomuraea sp. NPDC026600]|uniref:DUF6262 family protein n=1 Tax=Nonomuraea sp. NPDC026600 TaxID=3155363 RepID=UPI0033C40381
MTPSTRTRAANQARQQHIQTKLMAIKEALRIMQRERTPITYPAVARRADVSRSFLYQNPDARTLMETALATAGDQRGQDRASRDAQIEASWRERALNAEDALSMAHREIGTQRDRIGLLLGQIRDLEADYTEQAAQRIATQNADLKRQVSDLSQKNRNLEEKLAASRSNNRFLDKRIADLEARLLEDPATIPE